MPITNRGFLTLKEEEKEGVAGRQARERHTHTHTHKYERKHTHTHTHTHASTNVKTHTRTHTRARELQWITTISCSPNWYPVFSDRAAPLSLNNPASVGEGWPWTLQVLALSFEVISVHHQPATCFVFSPGRGANVCMFWNNTRYAEFG